GTWQNQSTNSQNRNNIPPRNNQNTTSNNQPNDNSNYNRAIQGQNDRNQTYLTLSDELTGAIGTAIHEHLND
ncbi:71_t:CDS:1, partial [Gigaspora margarita]